MWLDKKIAQQLYESKIFLGWNSGPPSDDRYGWLQLPADLSFGSPVRIEERTGLYGGRYVGSVGAPGGHGLANVGSFSYSYSPLPAPMKVGRYCSISAGLRFLDSHHPTDLLTTSAITFRPQNKLWDDVLLEAGVQAYSNWHIYDRKQFPVVGNDVWIARDVVLAMGITIGDGAIIAANSVVTKDVAPYSLVGGNPGECRKTRFHNEVVQRLLALKWWDLDPVVVARVSQLGLAKSLDYLERHRSEIAPFEPRVITLSNNGAEESKQVRLSKAAA